LACAHVSHTRSIKQLFVQACCAHEYKFVMPDVHVMVVAAAPAHAVHQIAEFAVQHAPDQWVASMP
jgi:hypothetical protein